MINVRVECHTGTVATVLLSGFNLESDAFAQLTTARDHAVQAGARAILVDLAAVNRVSPSGIGALVELAALRGGPELVLCGLPEQTLFKINRLGLDHVFHHHKDRAAALASPKLIRHRLAGLRAVVMADAPLAGNGAGLTGVLDRMAQAGVGEAVVCTGQRSHLVAPLLAGRRFAGMPVFLMSDGGMAGRQDAPPASATALGRLHAEGNLTGDTLVVCADGIRDSDTDIASFYADHGRSGADVTVAAPAASDATFGPMAEGGIYMFGPRALTCTDTRPDRDIATHLLPAIRRHGLHVLVHGQSDDGDGAGYAQQHWAAE